MLYVLVVLSLGLMVSGFALRQAVLVFASSIAWFILGIHCYISATGVWDIYYCLFIFCFPMVLTGAFGGVAMLWSRRPAKEAPLSPEEEEEATFKEEEADFQRNRPRVGHLPRGQSPGRLLLPPLPRVSNYSKTGIHEEKK